MYVNNNYSKIKEHLIWYVVPREQKMRTNHAMKKILLFRQLSTVTKSKSNTAYRQSSSGKDAARSSYPSPAPPTLSTVTSLDFSSILNTMYLCTFFHFISMNEFLHSSATHIPVVAWNKKQPENRIMNLIPNLNGKVRSIKRKLKPQNYHLESHSHCCWNLFLSQLLL